VLWIGGSRLPLADAEEVGIEAADVLQECAPLTGRSSRHARFGVVVIVDIPSLGGNLRDQVVASQQRIPQQLR
jgi:hypothetical protein